MVDIILFWVVTVSSYYVLLFLVFLPLLFNVPLFRMVDVVYLTPLGIACCLLSVFLFLAFVPLWHFGCVPIRSYKEARFKFRETEAHNCACGKTKRWC